MSIVNKNQLKNCPINQKDILTAEHIFGPDVGSLKGKTVRRKGGHVEVNHAPIPLPIMERYHDVTLGVDVMYVNSIPFLVTVSRNIQFGTVEALKSTKMETILECLKKVVKVYMQRGFRVIETHMDGEFESLRGDLAELKINLNTTARDEHVPEIKRYIRTLKERM